VQPTNACKGSQNQCREAWVAVAIVRGKVRTALLMGPEPLLKFLYARSGPILGLFHPVAYGPEGLFQDRRCPFAIASFEVRPRVDLNFPVWIHDDFDGFFSCERDAEFDGAVLLVGERLPVALFFPRLPDCLCTRKACQCSCVPCILGRPSVSHGRWPSHGEARRPSGCLFKARS